MQIHVVQSGVQSLIGGANQMSKFYLWSNIAT